MKKSMNIEHRNIEHRDVEMRSQKPSSKVIHEQILWNKFSYFFFYFARSLLLVCYFYLLALKYFSIIYAFLRCLRVYNHYSVPNFAFQHNFLQFLQFCFSSFFFSFLSDRIEMRENAMCRFSSGFICSLSSPTPKSASLDSIESRRNRRKPAKMQVVSKSKT